MEHSHADHEHDGERDCSGEAGAAAGAHAADSETKCHGESDDAKDRREVLKKLKTAAFLCVVFFAVEIVGGLLAGSLAILSDAAHLFSDFASFAVAIFANYLASLPSTELHTYGLKRTESLAALFSMVSLAIVCVWLGVEALKRLYDMVFHPDIVDELYSVDGRLMSGIAAIGVLVNVALAVVLGEHHVHMPGAGGHCHDHDHADGGGHSHDHDHAASDSSQDRAEKGNHSHDHDHAAPSSAKSAAASDGHSHSHDHAAAAEAASSSSTTCNGHSHSHDHGKSDGEPTETEALLKNKKQTIGYERIETPEHWNELRPPCSSEAKKKKRRNVNLDAAYLHVLGDLAQSVAVLIAGAIIWVKPEWMIIDPLCTLGFCMIVFYSTLGVIRRSVSVLLEEVPPHLSYTAVYTDLTGLPNVQNIHHLHIWCISDGMPCISLHASATDDDCGKAMKQIQAVCKKHGITHVTAQVQPDSCGDCITCDGDDMNNECY